MPNMNNVRNGLKNIHLVWLYKEKLFSICTVVVHFWNNCTNGVLKVYSSADITLKFLYQRRALRR